MWATPQEGGCQVRGDGRRGGARPAPTPGGRPPLDKAPDFSLGRAEGGASGTIRVPARLVAAGAPLTLQVAQRHAGRARGGARGP